MSIGPLDAPAPETESEYGGDGQSGWAGRGDLGRSKGRQPTGGELAAEHRRQSHADLPESAQHD